MPQSGVWVILQMVASLFCLSVAVLLVKVANYSLVLVLAVSLDHRINLGLCLPPLMLVACSSWFHSASCLFPGSLSVCCAGALYPLCIWGSFNSRFARMNSCRHLLGVLYISCRARGSLWPPYCHTDCVDGRHGLLTGCHPCSHPRFLWPPPSVYDKPSCPGPGPSIL